MNSKRLFLAAVASTLASMSALAAGPAPLELFGTPLKNAQRIDLRKVLANTDLKPTRVDDNYWADTYNPERVLEGATYLAVTYTDAGSFAQAQYKFPSHVDTGQIKRVVDFVASKYGRPNSTKGNYGLGEVVVTWNMPQGMKVTVSRGWPDTTTYLSITDISNIAQVEKEHKLSQNAATQARAKAQSKAF